MRMISKMAPAILAGLLAPQGLEAASPSSHPFGISEATQRLFGQVQTAPIARFSQGSQPDSRVLGALGLHCTKRNSETFVTLSVQMSTRVDASAARMLTNFLASTPNALALTLELENGPKIVLGRLAHFQTTPLRAHSAKPSQQGTAELEFNTLHNIHLSPRSPLLELMEGTTKARFHILPRFFQSLDAPFADTPHLFQMQAFEPLEVRFPKDTFTVSALKTACENTLDGD